MQSGFFDLDNRYAQLNKLRDPLIELNRVIDWELFRAPLSKLTDKPRKSAAGHKQIDRVLLFKMLVLQRLHNLADEALEYQVKDRLSFMRFLGLGLAASVPDARTLWVFREELKEHNLTEELFERFHASLRALGQKEGCEHLRLQGSHQCGPGYQADHGVGRHTCPGA